MLTSLVFYNQTQFRLPAPVPLGSKDLNLYFCRDSPAILSRGASNFLEGCRCATGMERGDQILLVFGHQYLSSLASTETSRACPQVWVHTEHRSSPSGLSQTSTGTVLLSLPLPFPPSAFCLFFLATPLTLQDPSSLTREWGQAPAVKTLSPNHRTTLSPFTLFYLFVFNIKTCGMLYWKKKTNFRNSPFTLLFPATLISRNEELF